MGNFDERMLGIIPGDDFDQFIEEQFPLQDEEVKKIFKDLNEKYDGFLKQKQYETVLDHAKRLEKIADRHAEIKRFEVSIYIYRFTSKIRSFYCLPYYHNLYKKMEFNEWKKAL